MEFKLMITFLKLITSIFLETKFGNLLLIIGAIVIAAHCSYPIFLLICLTIQFILKSLHDA